MCSLDTNTLHQRCTWGTLLAACVSSCISRGASFKFRSCAQAYRINVAQCVRKSTCKCCTGQVVKDLSARSGADPHLQTQLRDGIDWIKRICASQAADDLSGHSISRLVCLVSPHSVALIHSADNTAHVARRPLRGAVCLSGVYFGGGVSFIEVKRSGAHLGGI